MKASSYKTYLLLLLMVILAFSYVDRLALSIVLQDVKKDLSLTDTQLGLITGFAFSLFYAVMGIPIGRWADRGNRKLIVSLTIGLWSCFVAITGLARNFLHLILIRVCVGVGEAGCVPPAHSLLADYYSRAERPRAMGIYMLAAPLSMVVGYLFAGYLNKLVGWRLMFALLALPGLVLALVAALTLREPRHDRAARRSHDAVATAAAGSSGIFGSLRSLWALRTYRYMVLSTSLLFFLTQGLTQWLPTFFIRSHGLTTMQVGILFTVAFGVSGLIGLYGGGALASRFFPGNERRQLQIFAMLCLVLFVLRPLSVLVPGTTAAISLMVTASLLVYVAEGPIFAIVQTVVPSHQRAMGIAVLYLFGNLFGAGLGPICIGALSDALRGWAGDDSLRYAMAAMSLGYPLVVWPIRQASRTVDADASSAGSATKPPVEIVEAGMGVVAV